MDAGLSQLLPAERGGARAAPGLSSALRKKANRLAAEGLLVAYEKPRPGPRWEYFRLTDLGYSYTQIVLQLSAYLEEESARRLLDPEILEAASNGVDNFAE